MNRYCRHCNSEATHYYNSLIGRVYLCDQHAEPIREQGYFVVQAWTPEAASRIAWSEHVASGGD